MYDFKPERNETKHSFWHKVHTQLWICAVLSGDADDREKKRQRAQNTFTSTEVGEQNTMAGSGGEWGRVRGGCTLLTDALRLGAAPGEVQLAQAGGGAQEQMAWLALKCHHTAHLPWTTHTHTQTHTQKSSQRELSSILCLNYLQGFSK